MNLSEYIEIVRLALVRKEDDMSDKVITRFINWAQRHIAEAYTFQELKHRFQANVISDQRSYNLPDAVKEVYSISVIDSISSHLLVYVPAQEFDLAVPNPQENIKARPRQYVRHGARIELYPIPDDDYTLEVRAATYPIDLENPNQESELIGKDDIIVSYAVSHGWVFLQENEHSLVWAQRANNLLQRAINSELAVPDRKVKASGFTLPRQSVHYSTDHPDRDRPIR